LRRQSSTQSRRLTPAGHRDDDWTRSVERRLSGILNASGGVPGANRDSGECAGCARYGKTVYFVLKEEITVGSWPRATLNLLDALRYIANADRIFVLSALAGSW
jgi:hypothetical protein